MKCKNNYADIEKYRQYHNRSFQRYYSKTAIYKPHGYTEEEDNLILKHDMTDHEISDLIGHSVKAIQIRRCKLKKQASNV